MKGTKYRYLVCPTCKTKRRTWISRGEHKTVHTCSKGHKHYYEVLRTEKIVRIMEDVMLKSIRNMFERDDIFYKTIKR